MKNQNIQKELLVGSIGSWTFLSNGERCMRLSICKAPTQKEEHKGQPQHWETSCPTLFKYCEGSSEVSIEGGYQRWTAGYYSGSNRASNFKSAEHEVRGRFEITSPITP